MTQSLTRKEVLITSYHAHTTEIKETTLPELGHNDVIIKVHYAPLIHFDLNKISGKTNAKLPFTPGFDLSGEIEFAADKSLIGKRVAYMTIKEGTFKSRIIANLNEVIILDDKVDLIKASVLACNPLTSLGIVDRAIKLGAKGLAITMGNSSIGIQVNKIATLRGLNVISIVRSSKRVEEMKSIGQKYVIDSSSEDFVTKLNSLMVELNVSVVFDALSGSIVGKLMKALPKYGHFINFGTQTGQLMSDIDATDFRWGFKTMSSFLVGPWVDESILKGTFDEEKKFIKENTDIFESDSGKVFKVSQLEEAVAYGEVKEDNLKVVIDLSDL